MTMKCKIHRLITCNLHNLPHQRREGTSWGHLLFDTAHGVREEKEEIEDQERLRHDLFEDSASK
jgi:hypothetical protein